MPVNLNLNCECEGPGICQRHGVTKFRREFELCKGVNCTMQQCSRYFTAWEQGRGRGQTSKPAEEKQPSFDGVTPPRTRHVRAAPVNRTGVCSGCKSAAQKAWSFAKTMAMWAADGFTLASDVAQSERLAICEGCPLNQSGWCQACGCHLAEKIKLRVSYCPVQRWLVERPSREFDPQRNLLMHIMPIAGNGVWQWNVAELLKRIDQFDGRRVVAILTPERGCKYTLDSVETVQAAFGAHRVDEWIVRQNNPKLREVVTWLPLLDVIKDEPGITFACHAKGVTHSLDSITNKWTRAQWQTCLDDWPSVERSLRQYSMAGSFKRHGRFLGESWHYSGTFYWFRNDDVFARNWRNTGKRWWGTETWPAKLFEAHETACLFCDDAPDVYKQPSWQGRINKEWAQWCEARSLPCPI